MFRATNSPILSITFLTVYIAFGTMHTDTDADRCRVVAVGGCVGVLCTKRCI